MTEEIFVTRPNLPDRKKLYKYLDGVLDRKQLTNNGQLVQELTSRLQAHLGVKNLLLVSSGTMALDVALALMSVKGVVYTTPFSFPATSSILCWRGMNPAYVDISPNTFNLDESGLKVALEREAHAVLATHVFGNPCQVDEIQKLSLLHNTPVIYDAAHAFGTKIRDQSVLNFGKISVLSFHATKVFNTLEGGALIIPDDEQYEMAKRLINFGIGPEGIPIEVGVNGKMNEFGAAVGLCLLDQVNDVLGTLQDNRQLYDENLSGELQQQVLHSDCTEINNGYMPVCFPNTKLLSLAVNRLEEEGIFPRRYFYPSLDTIPAYNGKRDCIESHSVSERVLCLPTYVGLGQEKIEEICELINDTLEQG